MVPKAECVHELIDLLNQHDNVTAVAMTPSDFKDWDTLEDRMIKKADGILANHIFTVRARDSNNIMIQEYDGQEKIRQEIVLKAFQGPGIDWNPLFKLEVVPPPGLPDIKWNELYSKWGRFVPEDRKQGLIYYINKPPPSLKKRIEEQAREARAHRSKRTRDGGKAVSKPVSKRQKKEPTKKTPAKGSKKKD